MDSSSGNREKTQRIKLETPETPKAGLRAFVTYDHDLVRDWAARHQAEPATGEASASGPATVNVNDGGTGIRFNFPGFARFRPISWEEWFEHFEREQLSFVFEEELADRAYDLYQARGGEHGSDRADWFEAKEQMASTAERLSGPSGRYHIVKRRRV
jgi:hypothetical protein